MKPALSGRWAESPSSQRREPTGGEIAGGFPCGPADQALFNELMFRLTDIVNEAVALVTASGLAPSETVVTQLLQSVRAQRVNFYGTAGGTANALTLTPSPAYAALADLVAVPIRFLVATGNTGAVTLNINGLGAIPIARPNGAALKIGDLVPGQLLEVAYTGTVFHILSMGASDALPTTTQIYTTPGVVNFTVPTGIYRVRVEVLGAGGGGGGGGATNSTFGGSGGGAGGFSQRICAVAPGLVVPVTVGAGGVAGIANGANGGAGGTSSFGAFASATGGQGGVTNSGAAVNGGNGASGDLNFQGADGKTSIIMVGPQPRGGDGGESRYGGGGSGSASVGVPGLNGKGFGAGAGGGGQNTNGGVGAPGLVIIQY